MDMIWRERRGGRDEIGAVPLSWAWQGGRDAGGSADLVRSVRYCIVARSPLFLFKHRRHRRRSSSAYSRVFTLKYMEFTNV